MKGKCFVCGEPAVKVRWEGLDKTYFCKRCNKKILKLESQWGCNISSSDLSGLSVKSTSFLSIDAMRIGYVLARADLAKGKK